MRFTIDAIEMGGQLIGENYGNQIFNVDGLVYGRNSCKYDIPVGARFSKLGKEGVVIEIDLELVAVVFYRESIDVIPSGHCAQLELKGIGLKLLVEAMEDLKETECAYIETG